MQGLSGRCLVLGLLLAFPIQVGVWQPLAAQVLVAQGEEAEAEKLLGEGFELFQQQTPESVQNAIEKWEAALTLYQAVGAKQNKAYF